MKARIFTVFWILSCVPIMVVHAESGYEPRTIEQEAATLFGEASEGLAKALEEVFKTQGKPDAYIKGQEFSLAMSVGVRYGDGVLRIQGSEEERRVFWRGPSIGFDQGLNCSKVFILVYNLLDADNIFRGFPGAESNLFYYGGASATYLESNDIVLVSIRLGMGLRAGINVGYVRFSRAPSWNPF
ncbi:DUF1134 domain-containing protein [Gammaproteobacteria bacterium]